MADDRSVIVNARTYQDAMRKINSVVRKATRDRAFELCRRLAELGARTAKVHFDMGFTEEDRNINVVVEPMKNKTGCRVVANGREVAFAEFGTGVYAGNGYEDPPAGIDVTPGSWSQKFGKGHFVRGKHEYWYTDDGVRHTGETPKMAMYFAEKEMRQNVKKIAEEVFSSW